MNKFYEKTRGSRGGRIVDEGGRKGGGRHGGGEGWHFIIGDKKVKSGAGKWRGGQGGGILPEGGGINQGWGLSFRLRF